MNKSQVKEFVKAQKGYLLAKANNETVKRIDKENKTKVLQAREFYTEYIAELPEEPIKRILEPIEDYRMSESDFETYCKLVYEENIKSGLKIPDIGIELYYTSVDCETRKALEEAEKQLFEAGQFTIPNSIKESLKKAFINYKYKEELIDLLIKLDAKTIPTI